MCDSSRISCEIIEYISMPLSFSFITNGSSLRSLMFSSTLKIAFTENIERLELNDKLFKIIKFKRVETDTYLCEISQQID